MKGSPEEGVGGVVLSLSLRLSLLSLSLRLSLSLSLTWRKKMLEGWSGITTFFPMASASAVAVPHGMVAMHVVLLAHAAS